MAAVLLGAGVLAVPSALGSAWAPWNDPVSTSGFGPGADPIEDVPADDPAAGLVYRGLTAAKKGSPCAGGYEVGDRNTCSHGPDAAPPGLSVAGKVAPIAPAAPAPKLPQRDSAAPSEKDVVQDEGGSLAGGVALAADAAPAAAAEVGPHGVVCVGDGQSGNGGQGLDGYGTRTAGPFAEYLASFRKWAAGVDTIYDASAQETGGSRHIRYVTTANCEVDVREVEIAAASMNDFNATISALKGLGYNRTDRKYMIFGESRVYCGIGSFAGDDRAGTGNRSNGGPSYGRNDSGCWNAGVAAHELGHNLGAVNNSAPNSSKAGHCVDEYDVMCYKDADGTVLRTACTDRAHDQRLDCNHDDYYHSSPSPGSYLATHWNVADNQFLIRDNATATPTPAPTTVPPTPTPSLPTPSVPVPTTPAQPSPTTPAPSSPAPSSPAPPTASPTATGNPAPALRISDVTATSARLAWDAAAAGTRYGVALNGRVLGWTTATGVRVTGLRAGTTYQAQIVLRGTGSATVPYTAPATITTPAAARPAAGAWFVLGNALTGTAAELYGARTADGTPLVSQRRAGTASQLWKLESGGGDTFLLRAKASGKCASAAPVAGTPVVQQDCASAQRWRLRQAADGTGGLTTAPRGLVLGLGGQRDAGQRPLVLQKPGSARYQAWVTMPGA
ncbi:RICIN domain-containing protein [Micromonospora sp. CPCC 205371]|nr:RICIN domain-containing protein [Micromonospora sp. CPCC 205371]